MTSPEVAARALYWFFVYGILGWCVEVIYAAIRSTVWSTGAFCAGPSAPSTVSAWWGCSTAWGGCPMATEPPVC